MKYIALLLAVLLTTPAMAQSTSADFSSGGSVIVGNDTRTCVAGLAGSLRYSGGEIEVCDGTAWAAPSGGGGSGASCSGPAICPNVGDVCDDSNGGTTNDPIFAGCSNYGGTLEQLFVSDNNQSLSSQWKTATGTNDIATDHFDDGRLNDAQVANSTTFPAFKLCKDLSDGGFTDWYLPARTELDVLWQNRTAINANAAGNFTTSLYWGSTELSASSAWFENFSNGGISGTLKTNNFDVRCVRRS